MGFDYTLYFNTLHHKFGEHGREYISSNKWTVLFERTSNPQESRFKMSVRLPTYNGYNPSEERIHFFFDKLEIYFTVKDIPAPRCYLILDTIICSPAKEAYDQTKEAGIIILHIINEYRVCGALLGLDV